MTQDRTPGAEATDVKTVSSENDPAKGAWYAKDLELFLNGLDLNSRKERIFCTLFLSPLMLPYKKEDQRKPREIGCIFNDVRFFLQYNRDLARDNMDKTSLSLSDENRVFSGAKRRTSKKIEKYSAEDRLVFIDREYLCDLDRKEPRTKGNDRENGNCQRIERSAELTDALLQKIREARGSREEYANAKRFLRYFTAAHGAFPMPYPYVTGVYADLLKFVFKDQHNRLCVKLKPAMDALISGLEAENRRLRVTQEIRAALDDPMKAGHENAARALAELLLDSLLLSAARKSRNRSERESVYDLFSEPCCPKDARSVALISLLNVLFADKETVIPNEELDHLLKVLTEMKDAELRGRPEQYSEAMYAIYKRTAHGADKILVLAEIEKRVNIRKRIQDDFPQFEQRLIEELKAEKK